MSCVIFDIDGTVADLSHRLHHIKDGKKDWGSFFEEVEDDSPIPEVIEVLEALYEKGHTVFLVSGRSSQCRAQTEEWLRRWDIPYHYLLMREEGDYRPDTQVKEEILADIGKAGYDPWLAVDDRQRLAQMWRDNGIRTLQCDDWEEREASVAVSPCTLTVMVGPSGAGKTTWIEKSGITAYRVSSDDLRWCATGGDFQDQTRNSEVFRAAHGMARSALLNGIDVVFDATNIKNKDRKSVVALAPEGCNVRYIVIDRPYEEKIKTAGWRPEWLIKKHHNTFKNNLKDILNGDDFNHVQVEDCRDVS